MQYLFLKAVIAIVYLEVMKIILAGTLFYAFLRMIPLKPFTALTGSLLFAFSGFMICGGTWYVFSYEAVCVSFLLFSFEKFYTKKIWYFLPIAIALIAIWQPFSLFTDGLLLLFYSPRPGREANEVTLP